MLRKVITVTWMLLVSQFAFPGELEDRLNARWQGAWVIINSDVYSNCNSYFSNNDVVGGRITSKAKQFFQAGEIGKIHKVDVKRARVSVFILMAEPILSSRQDGPFTLYEVTKCKAELRFNLGRSLIKKGGFGEIDTQLSKALQRFDNESGARRAETYNQRKHAPFPEDYEETLAEYEHWKVEQVNVAVQKRLDQAVDEMGRILARVRDDSEYARGFVAGIKEMKRQRFGNCDQLISAQIYSFKTNPAGRITANYKEGYDDGQQLAFNQELTQRLRSCFL